MTDTLEYPFQQEPVPGDGSSVEIAPGLLWLRMPLRGSLAFINVWAIADPEGWSIIDTGLHSADTIEAWRSALRGCLGNRPIVRIVVTHMHPDHCGMVGWMAEQFGAPLWMSRLEYLTCRVLVADTGRPVPQEAVGFYRAAGWSEEAIDWYRIRFGSFGKSIAPLPAAFHRLSAQDELRLGDYTWRVIIGRGHSPEHACLYCAERGLLISGDQVLPRISSNVSVFPTEPDADPLADWLSSLTQLKARVPDDVLVLPAHNSPFVGLHARIDAL
ncbi:MAG: MBL fold metallo-hydrolase, partial [Alphaproteobacteria bacterium]|nr:MBL fold metallo-hydrolase [Alphaproteobacteria bacterium]